MRVAEASIEIAAPLERVWAVMLDVARYGEWNPFLHQIDAREPPRAGSELILHVKWPSGGGARSRERITRLEAPADGRALLEYEFLGLLHNVGAVRGLRAQSLRQSAAGTTYHTREDFGGWLSWALPLAKIQAGFEAHAQALKARAESPVSGA